MNEFNTAGIKLLYATSTSGRPDSGYTAIPNVKSIDEINPEPSTLETTDLDALVWKTYIEGLKDPGGSISVGVNITKAFAELWDDTVVSEYEDVKDTGAMWFQVYVPGLKKGFYLAGIPSPLGLPAIEVDSVFEGSVYITPTEIEGWAEASAEEDANG